MKAATTSVISGLVLAFCLQPAYADDQENVHPYLTRKFTLDLGMFFPDREVRLRVDGPIGGIAEEIDIQKDFGLKQSDETLSLNFGWRFGEKWELQGQYFDSSGARRKFLEKDIEWKDIVFGAGTGAGVGQNFTLYRAFFARRFKTREKHKFGVGLGLHWLEIGAFIEGNIIINGGGTEFRRETVEAAAPLPNIGAWYMYSITPKLVLRGRLDWLSAKVGDYDGTLINAAAGANYQLFENFGIGLSYNLFNLDVGVRESDWRGKIETSYEGLFAYASFFW